MSHVFDDPPPRERTSADEVAEDMLDVLERLQGLSIRLAQVVQAQRQQATELATLRRDLLGDRRALANRSAFDAIHPTVDHLQLIHDALDEPAREDRVQLAATLGALRRTLQALGFEAFAVELGEPFDPARMECIEYADGERGVVLGVVHPGYRAGDAVVRPCGVRIADPAAARVSDGSLQES